ncbi:hypothetical protein [Amycolatopsis sp. NPDC051102]|uniref:hypothetical protein n=1 Tax=Amycolatopsis sp. NPDC051102 TaxID=3155163 RepID=UPI00342BD93C
MRSVHRDVFALLEQWRDELDAVELTVPINLPALQARQRYEALRFPSVAQAVEQVRATVLRGTAFPPVDEVVAVVTVEVLPAVSPGPPYPPAWTPDELYPYPAAG